MFGRGAAGKVVARRKPEKKEKMKENNYRNITNYQPQFEILYPERGKALLESLSD